MNLESRGLLRAGVPGSCASSAVAPPADSFAARFMRRTTRWHLQQLWSQWAVWSLLNGTSHAIYAVRFFPDYDTRRKGEGSGHGRRRKTIPRR